MYSASLPADEQNAMLRTDKVKVHALHRHPDGAVSEEHWKMQSDLPIIILPLQAEYWQTLFLPWKNFVRYSWQISLNLSPSRAPMPISNDNHSSIEGRTVVENKIQMPTITYSGRTQTGMVVPKLKFNRKWCLIPCKLSKKVRMSIFIHSKKYTSWNFDFIIN